MTCKGNRLKQDDTLAFIAESYGLDSLDFSIMPRKNQIEESKEEEL